MAYTVQSGIDEVRQRAMLPASSVTTLGTTDPEILLHMNSVMEAEVVPLVLSCAEEFFVVTVDIPLVANQSQYRVPNANVGGRIRNVSIITGNVQIQLSRIEPERLGQYTTNGVGAPLSFFMDGGNINLCPGPGTQGGTLRVRYYARPGQMTNVVTNYVQISAISYNAGLTTITFTATPAAGGTLVVAGAGRYDIISNNAPFETAIQAALTAGVGPFTITQSTNLPQTIQVGDWVCLPDTSPVMQVPVDAQSYLIQLTTCALLEQLGDLAKLVPAEKRATRLKENVIKTLTPRTDGNPQKMRGLMSGSPWYGINGR